MTVKQISLRTETILHKMGFASTRIEKAEKDRVVAVVDSKFPRVRKALSKTYGHAAHNIEIAGGRRATWHIHGKGTLIAKTGSKGKVKITFSTMPFISA